MTTTDFVLTMPYERLIRGDDHMPIGIYHLHRLTARQCCRLHHSMTSIKYVQDRLKTLVDNDYLRQSTVPTELYRSPYYYSLGTKSAYYLRELGYPIPASFRAVKEVDKTYLHIRHESELNDVIISAALLGKAVPEYRLHTFIHDRELGQKPYYTTWRGDRLSLVPDAFVDFCQISGGSKPRHLHLLLEHDCDSEKQWAFRRRIRAYILLLKSEAYKERFKVNSITVAFTTFTGEKRRDEMREWTWQELHGEPKELYQDFLFTTQPKPPDPRQLWVSPCWYTPCEGQPLSLLVGE